MLGPDVDIDTLCVFGAGASSSSLRVRSMTSSLGRLLDLEAEGAVESSLEESGGVLTLWGVKVSIFGRWSGLSPISTRSSSSSSSLGVG